MSITHAVSDGRLFFSLWSKKIRTRNRMHKSKHHSGEPGRDGQARDRYCTFRLREMEATELADHAAASGRSVSQLVRLRVIGQPPPVAAAPLANRKMYEDLARTTANLNQLCHHLNEAAARGLPEVLQLVEVKTLLVGVMKRVSALRADLLGVGQK